MGGPRRAYHGGMLAPQDPTRLDPKARAAGSLGSVTGANWRRFHRFPTESATASFRLRDHIVHVF